MRVKKCTRGYVDIYRNPDWPGRSRIPIDRCPVNINHFLNCEIELTKNCGCPSCDFRRNMLREIQYELTEYRQMKAEQNKKKIHYVNNH